MVGRIDRLQAEDLNPCSCGLAKLQAGLNHPRIVKYQPAFIRKLPRELREFTMLYPALTVDQQARALTLGQSRPLQSIHCPNARALVCWSTERAG